MAISWASPYPAFRINGSSKLADGGGLLLEEPLLFYNGSDSQESILGGYFRHIVVDRTGIIYPSLALVEDFIYQIWPIAT